MSSPERSAGPFNAIIAVAFILFCGAIAFFYFRGDSGKQPPQQATQPTGQPAPAGKPATPSAALEITFYSSSAKKAWVEKAVEAFHQSGKNRVKDKAVAVKVFHVLSGESLEDMKEGRIKPDVWSPGDESWLVMAAAHWKEIHKKELFDKFDPLLNVPLVIALWEPMARALGYPKPLGWADVVRLARNPKGWASLNHPEWGLFRWGHAHPDANSGFLSVVSLVYAGAGKTTNLTPQDMKRPEVVEFLKAAEGSVEHYGLSNDWIDQVMHEKGPAYLSAAVQYENTIIESNAKNKNQPFKLVAVYPSEGAVWTQHPAAIINESWMTPEKKEACRVFIDFLLSERGQRMAMELGLRPIDASLTLSSPFDAEHGVMEKPPLDKKFQIPAEATLKRVRDLWEEVKLPAVVSLVIDRSGSMRGEPMQKAKEGAMVFLKSMKPRDSVELVVFGTTTQNLTPFCLIRDCGEQAAARLDGIFAEGNTCLYDSVLKSFEALEARQKADQKARCGMIVLSDGRDTSSKITVHDFLDRLPKPEEAGHPKIFTIAYGPEADKNLLTRISHATGGKMFVSTPKNIHKVYIELSANF